MHVRFDEGEAGSGGGCERSEVGDEAAAEAVYEPEGWVQSAIAGRTEPLDLGFIKVRVSISLIMINLV